MTIAVVQSATFNGAWSGSFPANVTPGNSVFLAAYQYTNGGAAMSSSAPLFGGSAAAGASKLMDGQPAGSAVVYGALWMLPNLAGGAKSVALTPSGGIVDTNVGLAALEVSGLGATPGLDATSPNPAFAVGATGNPASGSTGAILASPEILVALAVEYGTTITAPGAPWTSQACASGCLMAWQIATSSGGAFSYGPTGSGQHWVCGVAAIKAAGGGGGPAAPSLLKACFP